MPCVFLPAHFSFSLYTMYSLPFCFFSFLFMFSALKSNQSTTSLSFLLTIFISLLWCCIDVNLDFWKVQIYLFDAQHTSDHCPSVNLCQSWHRFRTVIDYGIRLKDLCETWRSWDPWLDLLTNPSIQVNRYGHWTQRHCYGRDSGYVMYSAF